MRRPELPIAVAAAAAVLAGCGGGGSTSGESSSSNSASAGNATSTERSTTSAATSSTASTHSTSSSAGTTTVRSTTHAAKPPKPPKSPKSPKPRRPSPATPAATVDAALTSPRCDLYTARLLQKSFGGLGGCEAALGSGGRANSVEIQRTQPEGKFALVVAVPHGGPSSGERLAVSLVKEDGNWRMDAIHSNVKVGP
jgi:hypothetical protein